MEKYFYRFQAFNYGKALYLHKQYKLEYHVSITHYCCW